MTQTAFPITGAIGVTRCGYCGRPLVLQAAGDWSCDHCRPLLAEIPTPAEWARFQRRVAPR